MQILKECAGAARIGIGGHIRPDGDCVGSCLALYQYLKMTMPEAYVRVFLQKPSDIFAELKGFDEIDSDFPEEEPFDVFFVLDCNAERLEESEKYFNQAVKTINIDHHISNRDGCGTINYVKPEVGSTSELIYDLIFEDGAQAYLDEELAKAIYVGIIHDTGVFQYSNTTSKTMRIGGDLIRYGFDFPRLIEETFYQKTCEQTRVMGYALENSKLLMNGACAVSKVTLEDMKQFGVTPKDMDGIVNQLRNIKGVHCAVFAYETEPFIYKFSMRSDSFVDVAKIASGFGGGGHMRAAGCTIKGKFEESMANLLPYLCEQLEVKEKDKEIDA